MNEPKVGSGPTTECVNFSSCLLPVNGIEFEHVKNKEKARSASMPTAKEMNLTDADVEAIARYLHGIAQLD